MRKNVIIRLIIFPLILISNTLVSQENNYYDSVRPHPTYGYYQYYVNLNLDSVSNTFDKSDFVEYLGLSVISDSTIINSIINVEKSFIGGDLSHFLDHSVTVYSSSKYLVPSLEDITSKVNLVEIINFPNEMTAFEPNDLNLIQDAKEHIDYTNAIRAWDITRPDRRILLGFTDTYLDIIHADLQGNIQQVLFNPPSSTNTHGTLVAGCLSAVTGNNNGISSIAGNERLVFSANWGNDNEVWNVANIPNVRVVNLSWLNNCWFSVTQNNLYSRIVNQLNVVVVASAGNNHCFGRNSQVYPGAYPDVICVTSINHLFVPGTNCHWLSPPSPCLIKDLHEIFPGDPNSTHHHYPEVDICAPGYSVKTTSFTGNNHNHYASATGTSFAAPIVASACGLVASYNPCLTAVEIRDAIINSADNSIYSIPDNAPYIGLLGNGKLDVYNAIITARDISTVFQQNITYNTSQIFNEFRIMSGRNVTNNVPNGNVVVPNNRVVTYNVYESAVLQDGFEVRGGGEFNIEIAPNPCF